MNKAKPKRVLIVGGGIAALAAAHALVEQRKVDFEIHIITRDDIWGGRASSWPGGNYRSHGEGKDPWDFRYWPPDFNLNHGFHAIWDRSTYANFWHMLDSVWKYDKVHPPRKLEDILISNKREMLVYENETVCSLRINHPTKYSWPLNSHLTDTSIELKTKGGWSLSEVKSFKDVVLNKVLSGRNFDDLSEWDTYQRVAFRKWCRDRGMRESIFNKGVYKFIFDGTYIAPFEMDATSGLMALWVLLRNYEATQWYYIDGGITELIIDPIKTYLKHHDVHFHPEVELERFMYNEVDNTIQGIAFREPQFKDYYKHQVQQKQQVQQKAALKPEKLPGLEDPFDYYISTMPLDNFYDVLKDSKLLEEKYFPKIINLYNRKFVAPVGTVNLQAWFGKNSKELIGSYKNVIAGLEPLCIIIDYKNILPKYKDKKYGSVLEINGSLQELSEEDSSGYWQLKNVDQSLFLAPHHANTIKFAKDIMIDIARRYKFPKLQEAVESEDFLEVADMWPDREPWIDSEGRENKIPPFLWKNTDPYNRFFVTGPGTLEQRPWTWEKGYPSNLFMAGDWTRNGFDIPSMEGAARSGRMAARAVLMKERNLDPQIDPSKPETDLKAIDKGIKIFDPSFA